VETSVPEDSTLGILNPPGYQFPDYLFFGDTFQRKIVIFFEPGKVIKDDQDIEFLLVSPDFDDAEIPGFQLMNSKYAWRLLQRTTLH
jgi:hypothetical protein